MPPLSLDAPSLAGATIVFDLDGTLVDTAPDLMGTLNHLLRREGLGEMPLASARSLVGQGAKAMLRRGFEAADAPLADDQLTRLFDDFIDHYRAHIADLSRPFEGVTAALDHLATQGARLAVCTNKRTDLSVALLDALDMTHRFAAVIGADRAPTPKPHASHLLAAIGAANGARDRAVMVGDSASDAGSARAAGVPLVLVDFGYTDVPAHDLGADILISHFDRLPDACRRLIG